MKPHTSSFSSPSSCDRSGRSGSGCLLSRILRRILCFSNLPLCSFGHFEVDERESPVANGSTPGVVARLMGLDSVPRVEPVQQSPRLGSADSFKTSRSLSCSIPPYRELEDEKFFILSFEKRRDSHIGRRKSSRNSRRIRQSIEEEESSKREKIRREKSRRESLRGDNKENENPCKNTTKKMAKKYCLAAAITFENEDESENSSPNSVLEFVGFSADQEYVSQGEISRLANSKTRRPLSEELENCGDSNEKLPNDRLDLEGENLVTSRHEYPNFGANLGEIGKFAALEAMRSSWLHDEILKNKHCLLEIGRDVASNIFDHLLEELVINLEQF